VAASASTHTLPYSGESYSPGVRTEYKAGELARATLESFEAAGVQSVQGVALLPIRSFAGEATAFENATGVLRAFAPARLPWPSHRRADVIHG